MVKVNKGDASILADQVFKEIDKKYGRIGAVIRGYRYRDDMTQAQLATMLGITKNNVSQMEYSKFKIDKKMAQKLADIFRTKSNMFI